METEPNVAQDVETMKNIETESDGVQNDVQATVVDFGETFAPAARLESKDLKLSLIVNKRMLVLKVKKRMMVLKVRLIVTGFDSFFDVLAVSFLVCYCVLVSDTAGITLAPFLAKKGEKYVQCFVSDVVLLWWYYFQFCCATTVQLCYGILCTLSCLVDVLMLCLCYFLLLVKL